MYKSNSIWKDRYYWHRFKRYIQKSILLQVGLHKYLRACPPTYTWRYTHTYRNSYMWVVVSGNGKCNSKEMSTAVIGMLLLQKLSKVLYYMYICHVLCKYVCCSVLRYIYSGQTESHSHTFFYTHFWIKQKTACFSPPNMISCTFKKDIGSKQQKMRHGF